MKTQELKAKARHELIEYGVNVVYLTLVFAAFTVYRRILLAEHGVSYENYGFAVVEALVLGKVIMLGDVFRLGRGLEARPLIYPTLYKTLVFSALVAVFKVVEHGIKGLWQGAGFAGVLMELSAKRSGELLADGLILLAALIPFFAIKELGRVMGKDAVSSLFFRTRAGR